MGSYDCTGTALAITNWHMLRESRKAERGSSREAYRDVILEQPVGDLGQVGGLAHAIHPHKHDGVGAPLGLGSRDIPQDVDGALGRQNARQGAFHSRLHSGGDAGEAGQLLPRQPCRHRLAHPAARSVFLSAGTAATSLEDAQGEWASHCASIHCVFCRHKDPYSL